MIDWAAGPEDMLDQPVATWEPKVGDRVWVRLTEECRVQSHLGGHFGHGNPDFGVPATREGEATVVGVRHPRQDHYDSHHHTVVIEWDVSPMPDWRVCLESVAPHELEPA